MSEVPADPRRLAGRTQQLETITDLLRVTAGGRASFAAILGEPGVGKSALLRATIDLADEAGFSVLASSAVASRQRVPFDTLLSLLAAGPRPGGPEVEEFSTGVERAIAASGEDAVFRAIDACVDRLEVLAATAPILLALDDLHWADWASLGVLAGIALSLASLPIGIVTTCRPRPVSPAIDAVLTAWEEASLTHIAVEPLERDEVVALVVDRLAARPTDRLLELLRPAGGNPFYVGELLTAIASAGALRTSSGMVDAEPDVVPSSLRLSILARLAHLPAETIAALRVAAVLGTAFGLDELAAVLGEPLGALSVRLQPAYDAGVLDDERNLLRFRHDLLREALYEDQPAAFRTAFHGEVAKTLAAMGASPDRVAPHLLVGARRGDGEAIEWLRLAARQSGRHAPPVAVELLEHAEELARPLPPVWVSVVGELVRALNGAGRAADAAGWLYALPPPNLGAAEVVGARANAARALHVLGRYADAAAEFERLSEVSDERQANRFDAERALSLLYAGDPDGAADLSLAALAAADRLGDHRGQLAALVALADARYRQGLLIEGIELLERAHRLAAGGGGPTGRPANMLIVQLIHADRFTDARTVLATLQRTGPGSTPVDSPLSLFQEGALAFEGGYLDDAQTYLEAAVEAIRAAGIGHYVVPSRALLSEVATFRGDLDSASRWISEAERHVRNSPAGEALSLYRARARLAVGSEKADSSLAEFASETARWLSAGFTPVARTSGPLLLALARNGGVDREITGAVAAAAMTFANRAPIPSVQGAAKLCLGLTSGHLDVLGDACRDYERSPRTIECAFAHHQTGLVALDTSNVQRAREHLERARTLYDGAGALALADQVRRALADAGIGAPKAHRRVASGWESLTAAEVRVVGLVEEGLSNREIGERLFVSRRTVSTHLVHVFSKLHVKSRAELAARSVERRGAANLAHEERRNL